MDGGGQVAPLPLFIPSWMEQAGGNGGGLAQSRIGPGKYLFS